ncbi:XRE family transcriptional regulator [Streptomyces sp. MS2.AVA.5]|uniref:XRE family transcriptional regulator n=1 Tax=Streptomyces achmelvichensis TaxID=3134111 RepID=A0ACC6Q910_9ACTN
MDRLLQRAEKTYGRFERGQLPHPPEDLLQAVGRLLDLTTDEYTTMWVHARGHRPVQPLASEVGTTVPANWQDACDGQKHMMYVTDSAWRVLAYNSAFADMFAERRVPRNTARWMLLTEEARRTLLDWQTAWAPSVAAPVRTAFAENPDNEALKELDNDLRQDPIVGPIYTQGQDASIAPDGVDRRLHHPLHGPGLAKMVASAPFSAPGARAVIVIFEPDSDGQRSDLPHPP